MATPLPPPGFDDLPVREKIDYVQALWERIARDQQAVPSPEWHRAVVREALSEYESSPDDTRPWSEVRAELYRRLKQR